MATKAERFRYESERSGAPAPKAKAKTKAKQAPKGKTALHGRTKAVFAYEETPPSVPPSRKSTRRSKNRQKAATPLTVRTLASKSSPRTRHDMG